MNTLEGSTIFVTGGAGFIGSQLVKILNTHKPKKIYILDNLYRGKLKNLNALLPDPSIEVIKGDICNEHVVDRLMSKSDYCFHLAAMSLNACAAYPKQALDVMFGGTFNVIRSAAKHKIKKLIYSSSASIYGLAQHFPTPETDNPYDTKTFYGTGKLFGEQMLRTYHYTYGLDYVGLRYFNVYGVGMDTKGRYTAVFIKWLDCIKNSTQPSIYGNGSTTMDFIYVTDVVKANILALQSPATDVVLNIGSGKETSLKQLLELLLKINNSSIKPLYVSTKVVNPVPRRHADITQARKLIGFSPSLSLEEGLQLLNEWYLKKNDSNN